MNGGTARNLIELDKHLLADVRLKDLHEVGRDFLIVSQDDHLIEVEVSKRLQHPRPVLRVGIAQRSIDY
jgi:hypothetical protein